MNVCLLGYNNKQSEELEAWDSHTLESDPLLTTNWHGEYKLAKVSYDLLLLGGSVGWPTSEKNQNSVAFNLILSNNITF